MSRSISLSEPLDLSIGHRQPRAARAFFGQAQIGLNIEQVILDSAKRSIERLSPAGVQTNQPDHGIDLVDRAVSLDAQIIFLAPGAGAERGRAVVAGSRINAVEYDHRLTSRSAFLSTEDLG